MPFLFLDQTGYWISGINLNLSIFRTRLK